MPGYSGLYFDDLLSRTNKDSYKWHATTIRSVFRSRTQRNVKTRSEDEAHMRHQKVRAASVIDASAVVSPDNTRDQHKGAIVNSTSKPASLSNALL